MQGIARLWLFFLFFSKRGNNVCRATVVHIGSVRKCGAENLKDRYFWFVVLSERKKHTRKLFFFFLSKKCKLWAHLQLAEVSTSCFTLKNVTWSGYNLPLWMQLLQKCQIAKTSAPLDCSTDNAEGGQGDNAILLTLFPQVKSWDIIGLKLKFHTHLHPAFTVEKGSPCFCCPCLPLAIPAPAQPT